MRSAKPRPSRLPWLPLLLLAGCEACQDAPSPNVADVSVMVSPAEVATTVGGTVRFQLTLSGKSPSAQELSAVAWSSSDPAVAVVDGAGVAVARAVGAATIAATFRGRSGAATLNVAPAVDGGPPADAAQPGDSGQPADTGPPGDAGPADALTPQTLLVTSQERGFHGAMAPGSRQRFRALARLADGSFADVTERVLWSSGDDGVLAATGDDQAAGEVRALATGTASLRATLGTRTAAFSVDVMAPQGLELARPLLRLPVGAVEALEARLRFEDRRVQHIGSVAAWQSSVPAVAAVTSDGGVRALAPGAAVVSASFGALSATAQATVTEASVASLSLSFTSARLAAGTSRPIAVEATYTDGSRRDATFEATFLSSIPEQATVRNGRLLALTAGQSSLTVTLPAAPTLRASATVTVTAASLSQLALEPARASLAIGAELAPRAIALFSDGTHQDVTEDALWENEAQEIASLLLDGRERRLRALSAGTVPLRVSLGGVVARGVIVVGAPTLVSLDVEPARITLAVGTTSRLSAVAVFSDGSMADVTESAAWSSGDSGALALSSRPRRAGQVGALAAGVHSVTMAFGGQSAHATVHVGDGELAAIELQPSNPDLPLGTELAVRAIGHFTDGSSQVLGDEVTWSSDDPATAAVAGAGPSRGTLSALQPGTVTVTARVGSLAVDTAVSVTDVTLDALSLIPAPLRLAAGTMGSLFAQARFSDGSTRQVSGAAFWSSSGSDVLTVWRTPGAAELTAVAPGTSTVTARLWSPAGPRSATAPAEVTDATVVALAIEPGPLALATGETRQLVAIGQLSDGSIQPLPAARWASSDRQRAAVANSPGSAGTVTGLAPGPVTITAWRGDRSASITLTIGPPVLTRIVVTPAAPRLEVGASTMLAAHAYYSDGSRRDISEQARWESAISGVAAVSDEPGTRGRVLGVGTGIVKVTTRYQDTVGYVFVTVVE